MVEKLQIVRTLGEASLLLPKLLTSALEANDRLKLRLTLLQEAAAHALHPEQPVAKLEAQARATGLPEQEYRNAIAAARALPGARVQVPGAAALLAGLARDLSTMLAPLQAAETPEAADLAQRRAALIGALPTASGDELALQDVATMASARRDGPDSVHRWIMETHAAVNRLLAATAVQDIDGAKVHHIEAWDQPRIRAFMAGIRRTAALAFGHPGLGTTATRVGARLTIQNDIGATEAHVLIVHVQDLTVTITYTDVHRQRTRFFMSLLATRGMSWDEPVGHPAGMGSAEGFYLASGRRTAPDLAALDAFLLQLGSKIVFLIDWNKARRALAAFISKPAAADALLWAATHEHGHRAFLQLGGTELLYGAIRRLSAGRIPYGARLDQTLGASESAAFVRRMLRLTSEGLLAGRSAHLIRDEIQADLAQLFDTAESSALSVLVRHLGVTRMLAVDLAEAFEAQTGQADGRLAQELAAAAKRLEEKADRLALQGREVCARAREPERLRRVIDEAECSTDSLEECAFLLGLATREGAPIARSDPLAHLLTVLIDSLSELVRATEAASRLPQGQPVDAADTLRGIDAVVRGERHADLAEREALSALMQAPCKDARCLVLGMQMTRTLGNATDHLSHAALALRDRVLAQLSA